ncbi:MAG: thioredoxin-disulfide reductase [Lachnospiraceae bacterium]|nr:thioredoxin-disulfide reductase [Lachnospiraceae bacterium]
MHDIIIIGAGTAGLSAAIYALRAGKSVLLLEQLSYGGQIINTPEVENYPGIKNISGFDFAQGLYEQATALGAELEYAKVTGITDGAEKTVHTEGKDYSCRAVIIATGAKNRPLGLPKEQELTGAGVSYCATCDGAFFRGRPVAVNGGGNTALEDALFLSNYCSKVYLIHRRDAFRGEAKQAEQLKAKENVEFVLNATITELVGEEELSAVIVTDKQSGEKRELAVDGLFIAIGQMPDNAAFASLVDLDPAGYVVAAEDCKTRTEGIYAAGDCRTKTVRQLTTAAADGAVAALAACAYIG